MLMVGSQGGQVICDVLCYTYALRRYLSEEVSMFFGHHKLNNMSALKRIFRGIGVYNICERKFFLPII